MLAVDEGALQREVDEAGDDVVLPDRDVAQHQRHAARRLQHLERLAHAGVGLVDLVEEQDARDRRDPRASCRMTCSAGIFFSSASATTTARSTPASTASASKANSIEPGQSRKVSRSPMNSVSATLTSTLIWWARASGEASPTVLLLGDRALAGDGAGAGEDGFEKRGLAACERARRVQCTGARLLCRHSAMAVPSLCLSVPSFDRCSWPR